MEEEEGVEEEEEGVEEEREGVGGSCARRFLRTNCGAGDEDTRERILSVKDHCGIWSQLCDHDHPSYTAILQSLTPQRVMRGRGGRRRGGCSPGSYTASTGRGRWGS